MFANVHGRVQHGTVTRPAVCRSACVGQPPWQICLDEARKRISLALTRTPVAANACAQLHSTSPSDFKHQTQMQPSEYSHFVYANGIQRFASLHR